MSRSFRKFTRSSEKRHRKEEDENHREDGKRGIRWALSKERYTTYEGAIWEWSGDLFSKGGQSIILRYGLSLSVSGNSHV